VLEVLRLHHNSNKGYTLSLVIKEMQSTKQWSHQIFGIASTVNTVQQIIKIAYRLKSLLRVVVSKQEISSLFLLQCEIIYILQHWNHQKSSVLLKLFVLNDSQQ